jgi:hypothetical protein
MSLIKSSAFVFGIFLQLALTLSLALILLRMFVSPIALFALHPSTLLWVAGRFLNEATNPLFLVPSTILALLVQCAGCFIASHLAMQSFTSFLAHKILNTRERRII